MWSIVEVARAAGVTSRTLRHYDAIGLLHPAGVAANGYREYGPDELLRLQQILVLRELGLPLPLPQIGSVLDAQRDRLSALREHHERLVAERDRLALVADTVARTIAELERNGGDVMSIDRPENLFEGFDQSAYAEEARERWPEEAASSERYTSGLSAEQQADLQRVWSAQMVRVAELRAAGAEPDDERVQTEMRGVYEGILPMWTPSAEAFRNLGAMYVDDERFAATFDRVSPGLGAFYRDAMAVFADRRLRWFESTGRARRHRRRARPRRSVQVLPRPDGVVPLGQDVRGGDRSLLEHDGVREDRWLGRSGSRPASSGRPPRRTRPSSTGRSTASTS